MGSRIGGLGFFVPQPIALGVVPGSVVPAVDAAAQAASLQRLIRGGATAPVTLAADVTRDEIATRLIAVVAKQLERNPADIQLEHRFIDDLGCDSLAVVELVLAIQEEFDVEIPDEEAGKIPTLNDAVTLLAQKLANA